MRRTVKWLLGTAVLLPLAVAILFLATGERASRGEREDGRPPSPYAPREVAIRLADPSDARRLGWSPDGLNTLFDFASRLSADTFLIRTGGEMVGILGQPDQPHHIHSMRKALLSAVLGQHVGTGPGQVPLAATLADLGIDDAPHPLTALQKQATVLDLLQSRSGVNHGAAAEGGLTADKDRRLGTRENPPGTVWAYNNWDYNVLTTILEQRTGRSVAALFTDGLARPLGLQDVTPDSAFTLDAPDLSRHGAAMFRLSGRDLAAIGQLYLDDGRADGRQILPPDWVARIRTDAVETGIPGMRAGHGDLWWLPDSETGLPEGTFFAWGLGQQALIVIPAWDTVIVHQSDTMEFIDRWNASQKEGADGDTALEQIALQCLKRDALEIPFCKEDRFTTRKEFDRLIAMIVQARAAQ